MKRAAALRDLSDDHHTALVLARRCLRAPGEGPGASATAWSAVRGAFDADLEPHFRIEEEHLLPALAAIGESALADRVRADHASLRSLAAESSANGAYVERFGRLLEAHVRFEEREVFEIAQARLPVADLDAIAAACAAWRRRRHPIRSDTRR